LEQHLTDYIRPDVVWTGGISELLRIATLAEAYHVPISPHNAMGPLQVLAGAHTMMTVPNLYRLEHNVANYGNYNTFVDHPLDFRGDQLFLSDRPGLGVDLNVELLEAKSIYRRPGT
jgi:galactonate dehydratase